MPLALSARAFGLPIWTMFIALLPNVVEAKLPKEIKIGEQTIVLNGEGTRSKAFVSIYESGLYLQRPSSNAAEILAADQLMAIRIHITSSFVSRSSLVASLEEGLQKSTGGDTAAIQAETQMFLKYLQDDVKKNDLYDFVYLPGKGIYILKNGKVQGGVPGLAFKQAFFGIWLSEQSVDKNLRAAMLKTTSQR